MLKELFNEEVIKTIKLKNLLIFLKKFKTMEKIDFYMQTIYNMFGGMQEVAFTINDINNKLKPFM